MGTVRGTAGSLCGTDRYHQVRLQGELKFHLCELEVQLVSGATGNILEGKLMSSPEELNLKLKADSEETTIGAKKLANVHFLCQFDGLVLTNGKQNKSECQRNLLEPLMKALRVSDVISWGCVTRPVLATQGVSGTQAAVLAGGSTLARHRALRHGQGQLRYPRDDECGA